MAYKTSGRFTAIVQVPFTGKGSIQVDETLVIPGVTQGTDLGLAIPYSSGTPANIIGRLLGGSIVANDSVQAGTTWSYREVELLDSIELVEYDYSSATADLLAVTSVSGTTVTISSLENNADCGWMYAVSGTGAGLLAFCTAINGGTATTKTATGWDSTTKVIRIHRFGHGLITLNSATTSLKSTAAAGSFTAFNFENYIDFQGNGIAKVLLDPTKHDNLQLVPSTAGVLASGLKPRFTSRFGIKNMAGR